MAPLPQSPGSDADAVIIQGSLPPKLTVDSALKYRLPALHQSEDLSRRQAR